jgi:hypothetical protein
VKGDRGLHMPHAFLGDDGTGHALYLHMGRAMRRATTATAASDAADTTAPAGARS